MGMRPISTAGLALFCAGCAGANAWFDGGLVPSEDAGALAGSDASSGPARDAGTLADPTAAAWLKEHNEVRASATPTPSPALPPLTWNAPAASVAAAWAAQCNWEHNANRGDYGENIAAATYELTPAQVVSDWAGEADHYNYATNLCLGTCGHYTQIVWRDTTSVGCAIQKCTTGSPFSSGTWWFAVCDYAPPGNWRGQKPY